MISWTVTEDTSLNIIEGLFFSGFFSDPCDLLNGEKEKNYIPHLIHSKNDTKRNK